MDVNLACVAGNRAVADFILGMIVGIVIFFAGLMFGKYWSEL